MTQLIRVIVCAIAGSVAFASLAPMPVSAEAATAEDNLRRRIYMLEKRMVRLEDKLMNAPSRESEKERALEERVSNLESVTRLLDMDGTYSGLIDSVQIWSHYCRDGEPAVWIDHEGYSELSCAGP